MIHENKDEFIKALGRASNKKGFLFTGDPLFDGGQINYLSLNELIAEKLRAGAVRKIIAPRDFYDIDFVLRNKFNLTKRKWGQFFILDS